MKKSFSLIEILVVITIIGLLAGVAAVSYSTLNKNSRDAKRKADIEQIRAALEMYRSNNGAYPSVAPMNCSNGTVQAFITPYLARSPTDPTTGYYYYCDIQNSTYIIRSHIDGPGAGGCTVSCGGPCGYAVGPYGQTCP